MICKTYGMDMNLMSPKMWESVCAHAIIRGNTKCGKSCVIAKNIVRQAIWDTVKDVVKIKKKEMMA